MERVNKVSSLRTALYVLAFYALAVGFLELFPSLSVPVFGRAIMDPAIESAWGVSLLTLGVLSVTVAMNVQKYGDLAWIFAASLVLGAADNAYFWTKGAFDARTIVPPIIINLVLAAWIWFTRTSGEHSERNEGHS